MNKDNKTQSGLEAQTTPETNTPLDDKYIAVVEEGGEIIMISDKNSPILKKLMERDDVSVKKVSEYKETLKHMTPEEIADIEEKIETLVLLDEVENVSHEMLSEAYIKKKEKLELDKQNALEYAKKLSIGGYRKDENGTIRRVENSIRHQNRNDRCLCGSGKKFKNCCMLLLPK